MTAARTHSRGARRGRLPSNWKDAVRNSIQLSFGPASNSLNSAPMSQPQGGRRKLLPTLGETVQSSMDGDACNADNNGAVGKPLTRSAFTKTLREREVEMASRFASQDPSLDRSGPRRVRQRLSVFDVRGLSRLRETFLAIDNSVNDVHMGRKATHGTVHDRINILHPVDVSLFRTSN